MKKRLVNHKVYAKLFTYFLVSLSVFVPVNALLLFKEVAVYWPFGFTFIITYTLLMLCLSMYIHDVILDYCRGAVYVILDIANKLVVFTSIFFFSVCQVYLIL